MTDAPETIWAWEYKGNSPWGPKRPDLDVVTNGAHYTRTDLIPTWNLTDQQVDSACLSFRHDFGLLDRKQQDSLRFQCRQWSEAIGKGFEVTTAAPSQEGRS